ncbi:MAG: hypothetical protein JXA10_19385 [Anaerolineae bacterium]|nr:hypothetical protein [Anaerolineae bacterium]
MSKRTLFGLLWAGLLALAACSAAQRDTIQTMVAHPQAQSGAMSAGGPPMGETTITPETFLLLATPTLDPLANSPMGTFTAIAQTIAPPTPDPTQYEIVLRGKPHFIEFHAWW